MDNNDVDFGEELRQLTRPKSLQKLKGELDYEDRVFTAQGKLEKAGLWHIINTPRPGPVERVCGPDPDTCKVLMLFSLCSCLLSAFGRAEDLYSCPDGTLFNPCLAAEAPRGGFGGALRRAARSIHFGSLWRRARTGTSWDAVALAVGPESGYFTIRSH